MSATAELSAAPHGLRFSGFAGSAEPDTGSALSGILSMGAISAAASKIVTAASAAVTAAAASPSPAAAEQNQHTDENPSIISALEQRRALKIRSGENELMNEGAVEAKREKMRAARDAAMGKAAEVYTNKNCWTPR